MKSIPGQMDFGIHAAVVLVLAVVFNLGLARYLSRSRTSLRPASLANEVHRLISDFDDAVLCRNLFKVDTIGDAYIVVGWLHSQKADFGGSVWSLPIIKEAAYSAT